MWKLRNLLFKGISEGYTVYGSAVYSPSEKQWYIIDHEKEEFSHPVDRVTIKQYVTKDKFGKDIYEDDYVSFDGMIGKITWEYNGFCIKTKSAVYGIDACGSLELCEFITLDKIVERLKTLQKQGYGDLPAVYYHNNKHYFVEAGVEVIDELCETESDFKQHICIN